MAPTLRQRLEGGLVGLLVGDALGVPYEFHPPETLPPPELVEMCPPSGFRRAHAGVPPGTWSDDGAQALCLLASLLERGAFDAEDFGRRLVAWHDRGDFAVDGVVFDVGVQTARAIRAMGGRAVIQDAGLADDQANGNGSLMRVLPVALVCRGTDQELVAWAHAQSALTHAHPRSQVCCALYSLWARRTLVASEDAWEAAVAALRAVYASDETRLGELEFHVRPDEAPEGRGSGYVVDCLRSARWAVTTRPYEPAMKAAIGLGHDTDTTACVAGGIAGLRDGIDEVPRRWRDALRGREILDPLLQALLAHHAL